MNLPRWIVPILLVLGLTSLAVAGPRDERWYVMLLQDQRAGYVQAIQEETPAGIRSFTDMRLKIKRGALTLNLSITSEWLETPEGEAISASSVAVLGAAPVKRSYRFLPDGLEVTTEQGGQKTVVTQPRPAGKWLPPAAAAREAKARLDAGDKTITTRTLEDDLMTGLSPVESTRTVLEKTTVEVFGKTVPAVKWKIKVDRYADLDAVDFVDDDGTPLRSEINLGGMKIVQLAADKALAMSDLNPPELLVSTLVKPDKPIKNPRRLREGRFVLALPGADDRLADFPTTPAQKVERVDARTLRVTISSPPAQDAAAPPGTSPTASERAEALESSAMIGCDDPAVKALLREGTAFAKQPPAKRAEQWRRFVHHFIKEKDLSVGLATASETARTRTGDCTEHAVLLAAILRADRIPARVASGLIYADAFAGATEIFGYHMWTQALLGDGDAARWTDVDATLDDQTPFDATHIALAVSNLADAGGENPMLALVPLLGRLTIKIEGTTP